MFDPFFDAIGSLLAFYYGLVPNYAIAIAMLTVTIMAVLTPLTIKGTRSMMELQVLQPEMKRIQQQYRGDREAMNREMVALYSEHGVNPLSGCLPNLVQIPVFLVLFRVLRGLTSSPPQHLPETSQLFKNLDANDPVQMVSFGVDLAKSANQVVKESFVEAIPYLVLFLVYFGLIFVQQRQMAARRAGQVSQISSQQQIIIKYLPYLFTVFAFFFQAGLVVYFITSTLWRIGQQAYIHRKYPSTLGLASDKPEIDAAPAKRPSSKGQITETQATETTAPTPPPGVKPAKKAQAANDNTSRTAAERRVAAGASTPGLREVGVWRTSADLSDPGQREEPEAALMEWLELTAPTVDDARDRVLDLLGVTSDEVDFEVLNEGSRSLFGLRRVEARVRYRLRPVEVRPKNERREQRRSKRGRGERGERTAAVSPAPVGQTAVPPAGTVPEGELDGNVSGRAPAAAVEQSAGTPRTRRRRSGRRSGRSGTPSGTADASPAATDDVPPPEPKVAASLADGGPVPTVAGSPAGVAPAEPTTAAVRIRRGADRPTEEIPIMTEEATLQDQTAAATEFLNGLLEAFGLEGQVVPTEIDEDTVELDVTGDGLGLLIGPKGQTLQAVHELVKTHLQRQFAAGCRGRVRLDIGSYRARRREALAEFVQARAQEVITTGTALALEPMSASDRKVVHDTVNDMAGVGTVSEGSEPRRRVVIVPAD